MRACFNRGTSRSDRTECHPLHPLVYLFPVPTPAFLSLVSRKTAAAFARVSSHSGDFNVLPEY